MEPLNKITGQLNITEKSRISVISPSLNHGRFLRETIESVLNQSYRNFEHVIVDGASTDGTIDILKDYRHILWVSEKEEGDNAVLDAIWKAFHMSSGEYVIFLCVSDGIVDRNWFKKSVEILDQDYEVSHVWGLPQNMMEDGQMGKLWFAEFLEQHPPQKMDFLPFWLATRHGVESNAVFRRNVFETCHPGNTPDEPYRFHPTLGFNYNLNTKGYLPYFLPMISYFGRVHGSQRQEKYSDMLEAVSKKYDHDVRCYRNDLLAGRVTHSFRDGSGKIIRTVSPDDLHEYRRRIWRYRFKYKLQRNFQKILEHI
jgi:glycosyltransferase involved in cell wall biosynthesis